MKAISAKRICAALIVLLLVAGAVLAAVCSGSAGEADAASLRQGSTGDKVSEMQRKLKNWGYYDGAVDGIFGSGTREAVIYFQRASGLSADGIVGSATAAALGMSLSSSSSGGWSAGSSGGTLRQGSSGDKVSEMQRKLKNWGYYDGAVDGIFGSGTREAVIYFQRANGLGADGIVGSATAAALGMSLSSSSLGGGNSGSSGGTLRQGSTGDKVSEMQRKLKNWGYYDGAVDGIFGSGTREAVIYFQRANGLGADGVVGSRTAAALGMTLSSSSSSGGGNTSSDLTLLARVVYGEARGEPYTGQVAVAAVVLNRVRSSGFPNTIAGVVYQTGAFDCVSDGQINLAPDDTAYKAAQDAMNGWDPTYGCLFYYNPRTATSAWMLSRPVKLVIGDHNFC